MDDPVRLNISIHSFWLELPAEDNSLINIFGVGVGVGLEVGVGVREGVGVSVKVGVDDGGTDVGNSLAAVNEFAVERAVSVKKAWDFWIDKSTSSTSKTDNSNMFLLLINQLISS